MKIPALLKTTDDDVVITTFALTTKLTAEQHLVQWDRWLHKQAYVAWNRLPVQCRYWLDVEDVYVEALVEFYRAYSVVDYSRSSFPTFMFRAVKNRLNTFVAFWQRQKRVCPLQVELDVIDFEVKDKSWDIMIDPVIALIAE